MTKPNDQIDIHSILEKRCQIAIIWSAEDVQEVRPDLDEEQAMQVLESCKENHDANYGINWEVLRSAADSSFPKKD